MTIDHRNMRKSKILVIKKYGVKQGGGCLIMQTAVPRIEKRDPVEDMLPLIRCG